MHNSDKFETKYNKIRSISFFCVKVFYWNWNYISIIKNWMHFEENPFSFKYLSLNHLGKEGCCSCLLFVCVCVYSLILISVNIFVFFFTLSQQTNCAHELNTYLKLKNMCFIVREDSNIFIYVCFVETNTLKIKLYVGGLDKAIVILILNKKGEKKINSNNSIPHKSTKSQQFDCLFQFTLTIQMWVNEKVINIDVKRRKKTNAERKHLNIELFHKLIKTCV